MCPVPVENAGNVHVSVQTNWLANSQRTLHRATSAGLEARGVSPGKRRSRILVWEQGDLNVNVTLKAAFCAFFAFALLMSQYV